MKSKHIPNKVIILGGDHHNALGLIRSLGEIGCEVFFISINNVKNYVVKSKYLKSFWHAENEYNLINIILENFKNTLHKPIIIPSDDDAVAVIDKNIGILKSRFLIPSMNYIEDRILSKMNKIEMNSLAMKHLFTVPKSIILEMNNLKSVKLCLEEAGINYPCIIKPVESIEGSKSDIKVNKNLNELEKNLSVIKNKYSKVYIQEFIEKEGELGIQGVATNKGNKVIIPGIINKIRESSSARGSTTYAQILKSKKEIDFDHLKFLIRGLISELEFEGIFDLELMYDKNNIYFIELNFRNGAYGYAYTKAGVNLPELWCLSITGKNIYEDSTKIKEEVYLMNEFADFKTIFSRKVSFFKWIIQLFTTKAYLIFNLKDIKPFIYKLISH